MKRFSTTSVIITDPLVKYRSLVSSGVYLPDAAQHRLARHLQKVYLRLKDYTPRAETHHHWERITRLATAPSDEGPVLALRNHPIWRNPLFSRWVGTSEGGNNLALIRVLSDHQAAIEVDSPRGFFLSGDVGTGKSMLLDLLADGLPTAKKRRWHFNTFMLHTFSQLEGFRRASSELPIQDQQYSLLWMAKNLVEDSPVLFLDEFQMPDRAASRILSNLFIAFFQLGGVLVASSNRMPEDLQRATGVEYTPPPLRDLLGGLLRLGKSRETRELLQRRTGDFATFLEVLQARCDFWHIDGAMDYRRRNANIANLPRSPPETISSSSAPGIPGSQEQQHTTAAVPVLAQHDDAVTPNIGEYPKYYFVGPDGDESEWQSMTCSKIKHHPIPWQPDTLYVYNRPISVPRTHDGHVYWDFDDLVRSFGPADYITLASTYHTFIINNIPTLSLSNKNEARRFITLLDALYEAGCRLVVRAAAGPDDIFFPETRHQPRKDKINLSHPSPTPSLVSSPTSTSQAHEAYPTTESEAEDATYSETIAEVYQDQISPFRPNVSLYNTSSLTSHFDPSRDAPSPTDSKKAQPKPDFGNATAFTGEDERFAYKRATSRLWELCSATWHTRPEPWWRPLPPEARHWEGERLRTARPPSESDGKPSGASAEGKGSSMELGELAGLAGLRIRELRSEGGATEKSTCQSEGCGNNCTGSH